MGKTVSIATKPIRQDDTASNQADAWVSGAEESRKMKRLTLDVSEDLHRRIKSGCAIRGTKMVDLIREFLEKEFPVNQ